MGTAEHRHETQPDAPERPSEFRVVVDSIKDYAIFLLDVDGVVVTWNAGAEALKGYAAHEVIGTSFMRFYRAEDIRAGKPQRMLREAVRAGRVEDEGWRLRRDGSRFWADVVISPVRDGNGALTGFVKVTRDLSERRAAEEASAKRERYNAGIADIGLRALHAGGIRQLLRHAAAMLSSLLDIELVGVFELVRPERTLLLRTGVGWSDGLESVAALPASALPLGEQAADGASFIELSDDERLSDSAILKAAGVKSGVLVPILTARGDDGVFGALGVFSTEQRTLDDDDRHFLAAAANLLAAAISRAQLTRQLRLAEHETDEERERSGRAEQALRERDEFISVAAHELRTPLTTLQLKLEGIERALREPAKRAAAASFAPRIQSALRQVGRLAELVERLLDVNKVSQARLEVGLSEVDVALLLEETVEEFREQARASGSTLNVDVQSNAHATWDRHRVAQAIANVLSNALKYGGGEPIDVRVRVREGNAYIDVEDGGIGVREEDAERIFQRFERAASTRHYGGLGLGLYISHGIISAHDGRIDVRRGERGGAVFTLVLPVKPALPAAEAEGRAS